jgi:hypothetical protein
VLNIPIYQGQLTLTTTGTSGAATLSGTTLNIPQYSGGGGTPAGSAGEVQFNSTPAGSFAASTAFVFNTSGPFLRVGASAPNATFGANGSGTTSATTSLHVRNFSSVDLLKVNDNGQFLLGKNGAGATQSTASIEVSTTDANAGIAIVPKGSGAITLQIPNGAASGGNARGVYSLDLGMFRGIATQVASGSYSVINGGTSNTASGSFSTVVGGSGNTASAFGASVVGGTESRAIAANSSVVGGEYGLAYLSGQTSFANGVFAFRGDNVSSRLIARRSITGAAAAELTLDGAAPGTSNMLSPGLGSTFGTINGRLWNAIVQLSAICTTAGGTVTVGESFIGTYNLGIKRIGATTSLVGTVQNVITAQADTNMSSSVVTITADDTNESLKIEFTPPTGANASTVIRVVATVYLTEVGY